MTINIAMLKTEFDEFLERGQQRAASTKPVRKSFDAAPLIKKTPVPRTFQVEQVCYSASSCAFRVSITITHARRHKSNSQVHSCETHSRYDVAVGVNTTNAYDVVQQNTSRAHHTDQVVCFSGTHTDVPSFLRHPPFLIPVPLVPVLLSLFPDCRPLRNYSAELVCIPRQFLR